MQDALFITDIDGPDKNPRNRDVDYVNKLEDFTYHIDKYIVKLFKYNIC